MTDSNWNKTQAIIEDLKSTVYILTIIQSLHDFTTWKKLEFARQFLKFQMSHGTILTGMLVLN